MIMSPASNEATSSSGASNVHRGYGLVSRVVGGASLSSSTFIIPLLVIHIGIAQQPMNIEV